MLHLQHADLEYIPMRSLPSWPFSQPLALLFLMCEPVCAGPEHSRSQEECGRIRCRWSGARGRSPASLPNRTRRPGQAGTAASWKLSRALG